MARHAAFSCTDDAADEDRCDFTPAVGGGNSDAVRFFGTGALHEAQRRQRSCRPRVASRLLVAYAVDTRPVREIA